MSFARAPDGLGAEEVERNDEIDPNRDQRKASSRRDEYLLVVWIDARRTFLWLLRQGPTTGAGGLFQLFRTSAQTERECSSA